MSKKRRIFDIDMPDVDMEPIGQPVGETFPAGKVTTRRGPMASAISENAESLKLREETEVAIRAENDALAHEHVRLKKLGLVVELIELDMIDTNKLIRDRKAGFDAELDELKSSITDIGLSNPIQVEIGEDGRFELVQGFRRLSAFRALLKDTGDVERYGKIPAATSEQGRGLDTLYRQMVDENLIRKDISFGEMAALAIHYAKDPATTVSDPAKAVATLFTSASYQKRSYIRNFVSLLEILGDDLLYVENIPRSLGLALLKEIEGKDFLIAGLKAELKPRLGRKPDREMAILRQYAGQGERVEQSTPTAPKSAEKPRVAKTTFQLARPDGAAKCTAASGRLEIRMPRDFSAMDRLKLEAAVAKLLDELDW